MRKVHSPSTEPSPQPVWASFTEEPRVFVTGGAGATSSPPSGQQWWPGFSVCAYSPPAQSSPRKLGQAVAPGAHNLKALPQKSQANCLFNWGWGVGEEDFPPMWPNAGWNVGVRETGARHPGREGWQQQLTNSPTGIRPRKANHCVKEECLL